MSRELPTLISLIVLSVLALIFNGRSSSASSEREALDYSQESGFKKVNNTASNFTGKTVSLRQLQISNLEFSATNSNFKRIERATSKLDDSNMYDFRSSNRTYKRALESEAGFQGDAPGISGKIYTSQGGTSSQSTDIWLALHTVPLVHCSEEVMTLTATGKEYTHIFVDRVDADPLPLFQVPAYCGYSVKVTWKDLVLMAPYDGCFVAQEDGHYILSLLWWGSPIKITCPVMHATSNPTPSVLCSQLGMAIAIEGAQEAAEKHRVKVNGKVLPLLSETCAYRMHSPAKVVLLHVMFGSGCVTVTDDENTLIVILDGKQFTLSCPVPQHPSLFPFYQPPQPDQERIPFIQHLPAFSAAPASTEPSKPLAIPVLPYERPAAPQFYPDHPHPQFPMHYQNPSGYLYPTFPLYRPAPPVDTPPKHFQMHQYPMMPYPPYSPYPISCPPFPVEFCSHYPIQYHYPSHQEPAMTTAPPTIQPMPWTSPSQPSYKPMTLPVLQEALFPPTPPSEPPKLTPSISCTRNRLIATLPSARADSIKVKDVKTHTWIPIASAPVTCNYMLRSRDGSVVLSSPLPSCHTKKLSPTVISLLIRFWDSSKQRSRTLQLQCHYIDTGTQPTLPTSVPIKPLHQIIPQLTAVPTPAQTPAKLQVLCSSQHMRVKLPPGPTSGILVQDASIGMKTKAASISEAPSHCGYSVRIGKDGAVNILLPYSSCHMTQKDGQHKIILKYQTLNGRTVESLLSCQASFSHECNVAPEQRLICGSGMLSSSECHDRGCCYFGETQSCFYPMDECTMDRHFVFSVHSSAADPPISPATLVTAGNSSCKPIRVTADLALFKIPLNECGVHRYEVGKTVIYMVEILNRVQPKSLNYGIITRESPVRLLVECRYLPGSVVSVGYLVKSPSLGPSIKAQGVFGVQLRIAKDEHYDDFYPQYHQPLRMLLGKPLYLEVRLLNPPDPTAMLLVHYCVAYPRSAKSAWILIYDGCPNFLDNNPTHKPPAAPAEALTNHVRRFTVTTFQFLSEDDDLQADEEIYFMCSTEVCLPSDGPCVEGCFADPSNLKA